MNKKTKAARKAGFASQDDMIRNGTKVFRGTCCDTAWDNPNSKKKSKKIYRKQRGKEQGINDALQVAKDLAMLIVLDLVSEGNPITYED